jgi:hypothetical protein
MSVEISGVVAEDSAFMTEKDKAELFGKGSM